MRYSKKISAILSFTLCLLISAIPTIAEAQSQLPEQDKIQVMILGSAHFANPNQDVINTQFPDVLKPKYQKQIAQVVDSLSQFNPTKIAVEVRPDYEPEFDSLYQAHLKGTHTLSRNERQQLGFRLGKRFEHNTLYAIDHDGEFPFREVMEYAKENDPAFVQYFKNVREHIKSRNKKLYKNATIREILRDKNSASHLQDQRNYYAQTAAVGDDSTWVGVDLVSKWHRRNIKIFGHLARIAESGDRIIVLFGSGHAPLLRYFVESSKEMKLIDPLEYL